MLTALAGGVLIGLAATLFWAASGRVAGVSGLLEQAVGRRAGRGRSDATAFIVGLVAAGLVLSPLRRPWPPANRLVALLLVAGLLVGFDPPGPGCTSGHGVCGVSRLSPRSLVDGNLHGDRGHHRVGLRVGVRPMKRLLFALGSGLLFGAGLCLSAMTDPRR